MAEDFSQKDFIKMQEQAIDRVREMQKKAQPPMAHQGRGPQKPQRFFQNESERRTEPSRQQPMKNQPPGRNDTPKKTPEKQPAEKPKPQNPLMSLLSLDKDMSVVLPLLLLLGREGADDMLTLALLYIMT